MFDCILNTPLSLVVNKVCFDEESISLIRMKNQQKVNEHYRCGKCGAMNKNIKSACVATKLKRQNTLDFGV